MDDYSQKLGIYLILYCMLYSIIINLSKFRRTVERILGFYYKSVVSINKIGLP